MLFFSECSFSVAIMCEIEICVWVRLGICELIDSDRQIVCDFVAKCRLRQTEPVPWPVGANRCRDAGGIWLAVAAPSVIERKLWVTAYSDLHGRLYDTIHYPIKEIKLK